MIRNSNDLPLKKKVHAVSIDLKMFKGSTDIILYGILFLIGVAFGSAAATWLDPETAQRLVGVMGGFVSGRDNQSLTATFISALTPNLFVLGIFFIAGFCAISAPIVAAAPCFKGMGFGLMSATMIICYGGEAIRYIAAMILPNTIWSALVLLFACRDSMRMSLSLLNAMKPQQRGGVLAMPGQFCAKMILYLILLLAGAALEAYSFSFFEGFFIF